MTEFFGPVLAVLRANHLDEAIDIVNETGFGLTSGLESLDLREQERWRDEIRAGNLYVNRVTTGAVVQRQPFGGMGKSAFGPGIKAGGPNYVAQLMRFSDRALQDSNDGPVSSPQIETLRARVAEQVCGAGGLPEVDAKCLLAAIASFDLRWRQEFGANHDHVRLVGQDNIRRYLPVAHLRVRVHPDDSPFEIFARVCAAKTAGCGITVSSPPGLDSAAVALLDSWTESWAASIEFVEESDEKLAEIVSSGQTERLRYASRTRVPVAIRRAIGASGIYIADAPVLIEGRIEMLWYLLEQSISDDYHRYGNLGDRIGEERSAVL